MKTDAQAGISSFDLAVELNKKRGDPSPTTPIIYSFAVAERKADELGLSKISEFWALQNKVNAVTARFPLYV